MDPRQGVLEQAVAAGHVPFAIGMCANAGGIVWSGVAGEAAEGRPAAEDTVLRIFSMTKAIGSLAAMILTDRGVLSMDTPVEEVLPEFASLKVLDGFDGDEPRLRAPNRKATIRNLATHTSGLVYEFWNADIARWMQASGHPTVLTGTRDALNYALAFDPGTAWDYGLGIDWLGQVVERVDGRRIDSFCREEIFLPLGMTDTAFEVGEHMAPRLARIKARGADGAFVDHELAPPSEPEVYGMGHALYSTASDYMRFLRMLLNRGKLDGARVLSEAAVDQMLENQIGDLRLGRMTTVVPAISADTEFFPGRAKSHSFAFMRMEEEVPGMRSAGSQSWAGVLNTHYWFDPARNVAGIIATQSLPFVEPGFMALYEGFERAVYANLD